MFQRLVLILFLAIILLTGCNLIASEPEVFDGQKPFMLKYNFQNALESRTGIEVTDRKFYYITEYFYGNKEQEVLEGELTPEELTKLVNEIINTYKFFKLPENLSVRDDSLCDAPSERLEVTYGDRHHTCWGYNIQNKRFQGIKGILFEIYRNLQAQKPPETES
ncbi:MAG TPA: hypothetical protein PLZ08_10990 [Bacillota bacterium]|nr:hypothetical protein [Bacillota bacterium]HOL08831.1 hypothetical protein [Bacillota bacterium]HPO98463.1 hypothetical protein [Bacillota bacterium]